MTIDWSVVTAIGTLSATMAAVAGVWVSASIAKGDRRAALAREDRERLISEAQRRLDEARQVLDAWELCLQLIPTLGISSPFVVPRDTDRECRIALAKLKSSIRGSRDPYWYARRYLWGGVIDDEFLQAFYDRNPEFHSDGGLTRLKNRHRNIIGVELTMVVYNAKQDLRVAGDPTGKTIRVPIDHADPRGSGDWWDVQKKATAERKKRTEGQKGAMPVEAP